jgi:hypothetical protein
VSRDALLYVADIVAAGEAILRYIDGVTYDGFASNDEKRSAVERRCLSSVRRRLGYRMSGSCTARSAAWRHRIANATAEES